MNRRDLLKKSIAFSTLLTGLEAAAHNPPVPPYHLRTIDPYLELHPGFQVKELAPAGSRMDDGHRVPELHDGMGCFAAENNGYVLIRNHEISEFDRSHAPERAWNPACRGGTTTIHLDSALNIEKQYLSLTGTIKNCSGGVMPWGSWLSCEEKFITHNGVRHGYVFEVSTLAPNLSPQPLRAMGRFEHEACVWEPRFGHIYMTEDRPDGNLYRFIPQQPGQLALGGRLQALGLSPLSNTALACHWIDIEQPDPNDDTVRREAQRKGAALFARPEGMWVDDTGIYFSATAGGRRGFGQIFHYRPVSPASGEISMVYESLEPRPLQPDALTRLPNGDLLICEDSERREDRIIGITPQGYSYVLARGKNVGWTGITFSPDRRILFVNQQYRGRTLAITGDWLALGNAARS